MAWIRLSSEWSTTSNGLFCFSWTQDKVKKVAIKAIRSTVLNFNLKLFYYSTYSPRWGRSRSRTRIISCSGTIRWAEACSSLCSAWPVSSGSRPSSVANSLRCFAWCNAICWASGPRKSQISFILLPPNLIRYQVRQKCRFLQRL